MLIEITFLATDPLLKENRIFKIAFTNDCESSGRDMERLLIFQTQNS